MRSTSVSFVSLESLDREKQLGHQIRVFQSYYGTLEVQMSPATPGFRTTSVLTRDDPAREALFRNLLENPPFTAASSLEQQRDIMDSLKSMNPELPADVAVTQITLATGGGAEKATL